MSNTLEGGGFEGRGVDRGWEVIPLHDGLRGEWVRPPNERRRSDTKGRTITPRTTFHFTRRSRFPNGANRHAVEGASDAPRSPRRNAEAPHPPRLIRGWPSGRAAAAATAAAASQRLQGNAGRRGGALQRPPSGRPGGRGSNALWSEGIARGGAERHRRVSAVTGALRSRRTRTTAGLPHARTSIKRQPTSTCCRSPANRRRFPIHRRQPSASCRFTHSCHQKPPAVRRGKKKGTCRSSKTALNVTRSRPWVPSQTHGGAPRQRAAGKPGRVRAAHTTPAEPLRLGHPT